MTETLYPLLLNPTLHTRVWGGRNLASLFGKTLPDEQPYGESWELHDSATVANGPLAGQSISDLVRDYGAALIGAHNPTHEGMPLLVKFLDANDWLSIQVHPNDEQAQALEGDPRGKTEAWIVLSAKPNAKLVIGIRPNTTPAEMAEAIRTNTLEDYVVYQNVQAGDVLFIAANTVHAIGPGLVIYEIQQSSDITYRLYDWGRMGLDGKPRQLHIEKGVQVSNLASLPHITHSGDSAVEELVACPYFVTMQYRVSATPSEHATHGHFHAVTGVSGRVTLTSGEHRLVIESGQTVLVPAMISTYTLSGDGVVLRSSQK